MGLGAVLAGLGGLAASGAASDPVAPFIGLSVLGAGALLGGVPAHLYNLLAPEGGTGAPGTQVPLTLELGHRYVYDPVFEYRNFAVMGAQVVLDRWRLTPTLWLALDDENDRGRVEGAFRVLAGPPGDGSSLDLELAALHHRYGTERFSMSTGELAIAGRLDLRHFARGLRGAFAEGAFGAGLSAYQYDGLPTEDSELLLARFAFGLYLGGTGELAAYYDHRHDDFAAGARLPGLGSGPAGHVGLRGHTVLMGAWGLGFEVAAGSAWVGGVSMRYDFRDER